jgi:hypothetical protein
MSKFNDILKAAQARNQDVETPVPAEPKPQKSGRPRGKRSNPDYEQVTAYIKRETYRNTKIVLLQQGNNQEFSELVEQLLSEWLSTQKSNNSNTC